jgi:hypothetical protein
MTYAHGKEGKGMKSMNRTILGLVASVVMVGALSLLGCSSTEDDEGGFRPATAADVRNQSFTCPDGEVFNEGLAGDVTRVSFTNDGHGFTLDEGGTGRRARGTVTFGPPCIAIVNDSNFPEGTGPQEGDTGEFPTCDYNPDDNTLLLLNVDGVSGLCGPGIPTGTGGSGD